MTVFKIFIVATALLLCPSLGAGYNCTRRYQRLLREAAVVKAQCPNAAFHDCCQVSVVVIRCLLCHSVVRCVFKMAFIIIVGSDMYMIHKDHRPSIAVKK